MTRTANGTHMTMGCVGHGAAAERRRRGTSGSSSDSLPMLVSNDAHGARQLLLLLLLLYATARVLCYNSRGPTYTPALL